MIKRLVLVGLGALALGYGAICLILGGWVYGAFLAAGGLAMIHLTDEEWAYFGLARIAAQNFLRGRQRTMYVEGHVAPARERPHSLWWFALSIGATIVGSVSAVLFFDGYWVSALIAAVLLVAFQTYALARHWRYRCGAQNEAQ